MYWDYIIKGWKQLIAKVVFPQCTAPESGVKPDSSVRAAAYDPKPLSPYTPDGHRDRSDSSLHLSC